MGNNLSNVVKTVRKTVIKHTPEILTGVGIAGMITTTVLAVKATPKALYLLDDARAEKSDELTKVETVKTVWKCYIPAAITGVVSASCLIGANTVHLKRNAALAAACMISDSSLREYKQKVVEKIGEKKEKELREEIATEKTTKKPVKESEIVVTGKGNTLCCDAMFGRYFRSDRDAIIKAMNNINRDIVNHNHASLNDFYYEIGLDSVKAGDIVGWNIDDQYVDVEFGSCLVEGEPCMTVSWSKAPQYDYDRF